MTDQWSLIDHDCKDIDAECDEESYDESISKDDIAMAAVLKKKKKLYFFHHNNSIKIESSQLAKCCNDRSP